jgi:hypothetical protein
MRERAQLGRNEMGNTLLHALHVLWLWKQALACL